MADFGNLYKVDEIISIGLHELVKENFGMRNRQNLISGTMQNEYLWLYILNKLQISKMVILELHVGFQLLIKYTWNWSDGALQNHSSYFIFWSSICNWVGP